VAKVEYLNLGVNPIFRDTFTLGGANVHEKGYAITDNCIGCGSCVKNCPERCIEEGKPYVINQNKCLHCGNCFEHCPLWLLRKEIL